MSNSTRYSNSSALRRFGPFVLLGVFLHFLALEAVSLLPTHEPIPVPKKKTIYLTSLPTSSTQTNRALDEQPDIEKAKTKDPEEKLDGQVVNLPPSQETEAPDDADYLAQTDNRTERETRSRHARNNYKNAMNELSHSEPNKKKSPSAEVPPVTIKTQGEKKAEENADREGRFSLPKLTMRDSLKLETDSQLGSLFNQTASDDIPKTGNGEVLSLGVGQAQGSGRGTARLKQGFGISDLLLPPVGVLARLDGAPANDHLEDVEEGEGTFLNTKRFKYASFFNRVHKGVSQSWAPLREFRRRDPTGRVYGRKARITVLSVTLDEAGTLTEVGVARSSGLEFLDREAVAAFRRAQPFPNPPVGLIDARDEISFNFSFHLVLNPRDGFRRGF